MAMIVASIDVFGFLIGCKVECVCWTCTKDHGAGSSVETEDAFAFDDGLEGAIEGDVESLAWMGEGLHSGFDGVDGVHGKVFTDACSCACYHVGVECEAIVVVGVGG